MRGKVLIARVEVRLIAQRLGDRTPEVVRHDRRRHPAEVLQHPHMRAEPVSALLTPGRLGERVVRAAEYADEDLRSPHLARVPIRNRHGLARVVDEGLVAGGVCLAQYGLRRRQPAPILLAEHTVLPAVRVGGLVLLPEQQPRHPRTGQLGVQLGEVRYRPRRWRSGGAGTAARAARPRSAAPLPTSRGRRPRRGADMPGPSTARCRSPPRSAGRSSPRPTAAIPLVSCARVTSLAPP